MRLTNRACAAFLSGLVLAVVGLPVAAAPAPLPASRPAASPATRPAAPPATRPAGGVGAKPAAEPLPSMDDLRALFDQAKYPDLLRQLPRVLVLRGKAAEPYNRYELLMLRFETHVRMKASAPALSTLAEAQEVTDDPQKVNYCKAVALLLRRSKNFQYQPSPQKKEKPPTIDVTDADGRKRALQALLADEMAVAMPKVEKALDGQSLAGIAEAVKALQGFDVLESAAGGGEEAARLVAELRTRGNALMAKAVLRMGTRADEIVKRASDLVQYSVPIQRFGGGTDYVTRTRRRGLSNGDYRELTDIVKSTDQIIPNARGLAKATGGKVKEVEDLIMAAEDLKRKADKALNTNYNDQ